MENNSISILLQLSRINLEELKSVLLPDAHVLRYFGKDLAKVTFTGTLVGRATSQGISTSGAWALFLSSSAVSPQHTPWL